MVGFGANRRGGRLPSFILIALMVIIVLLSYNYWTVSSKHGRLLDELAEVQTQVKRTDAARSRLEKRNSELMLQVDTHRKQIDQKDGDYSVLEGKLQARDALVKKCTDEKMKLQSDVTVQMSEIHRLKEQVRELKQEIIRQEDHLRELKKNSTNLERKLEYESLQCGRQIAQLKDEYEESRKTMEEQAAKLRQGIVEPRKAGAVAAEAEGGTEVEAAAERHTVANLQHDGPHMKEDMGKPGSDAGMPGIEDSEVGKMDDVRFTLKKPAITQKRLEVAEMAALGKEEQPHAGEGGGAGAGGGAGPVGRVGGGAAVGDNTARGLPLDRLGLPRDVGAGHITGGFHAAPVQQQVPQAVVEKPVARGENSKMAVQADEAGEQQGQLRGPDGQRAQGMAPPPPPNPVQVLPNPIEPRLDRDTGLVGPLRHRQSRFFDENESPVDPRGASKLADYNGDDGNVGEYEADKQAELAYNEEEDGDGGEEDAQDDDDREGPGDHAVDYGKRHQAIDIL
ncbi:protein GOLM2 isoform X1 [Electrophorus electricus]|uniref:Protein GOLM2 n=1 Tax=Electrophorus electricus TaxID=8005 RepID=A0A4W4GJX4_ELEEL|nr:protein GOLM2 isoform X1 [Electrophorus electricus]